MLGRRRYPQSGVLRDVKSYSEVKPAPLIGGTAPNTFDTTETITLPWGVNIKSATHGLIGFFSTLADTSANSTSGTLSTVAVSINGNSVSPFAVNSTKLQAINAIKAFPPATLDPAVQVFKICLQRDDGQQTALVSIGANGRATDVTAEFIAC